VTCELSQQDLFDLAPYPVGPGFKGVSTSQEAAAIAPVAGSLCADCLTLFKSHPFGLTADEVAGLLGMSVLAIRPRVAELHRDGFIKDAGVRRRNSSGRSAAVWTFFHGGETK
jgi:hypothetical protein